MNDIAVSDLMSLYDTAGAPTALMGLMTGPWGMYAPSFEQMQAQYASHRMGPKATPTKADCFAFRAARVDAADYRLQDGVAIIDVLGPLVAKPGLFTLLFGGETFLGLANRVKHAAANKHVGAIVLNIDSPGGSVAGCAEAAEVVLNAAKAKPVVSHSGGYMASAAYWVGCAANAVYLGSEVVQAGCVGILKSRHFDPAAGVNSLGLCKGQLTRLEQGSHRPYAATIDHDQSQVNALYEVFVAAVARARGVSFEHAAQHMAEGRIFIGSQAVNAGLADGLMPLGALVDSVRNSPDLYRKRARLAACRVPTAQRATHKTNFASAFLKVLGSSAT